jgi:protein SCO1/2
LLTGFAQADEIKLASGILFPEAKNVQPFTLSMQDSQDHTSIPFTQNNLQGRWTLLFFGFTNCPMLCPTTMANIANAYVQLQNKKFSPIPQVVFVSVDPERDTAKKTYIFATTFNQAFIGARTDDKATLGQMTHDMDTMFEKVALPKGSTQDKDSSSNYTIDHTGEIMVFNPKGQLAAILTMPHTADNIVADYQTIVQQDTTKKSGFWSDIGALFSHS